MREFLSTIAVSPIYHSELPFVFNADTFSFEPTSSDEDGGLIFNCDHVFVVDTPDNDTLSFFSQPRSVIVTLKDSSQKLHHIGTADVPARVILQPYLNRTRLYMSCKMLRNPLV